MTPLFACFPVCMTFVAIGIVGLVVVMVMGTNREGPNAPDANPPTDMTTETEPGFPPLWVVALIFAVVLLHFAVLLWIWPEL
ncbi:MAG: hypothetical protein C0467_03675 [Planctomycetaceae bacterium]|nr:hypothetical protein [Planctomycetaceae bacterium]